MALKAGALVVAIVPGIAMRWVNASAGHHHRGPLRRGPGLLRTRLSTGARYVLCFLRVTVLERRRWSVAAEPPTSTLSGVLQGGLAARTA